MGKNRNKMEHSQHFEMCVILNFEVCGIHEVLIRAAF